MTEKASEQRSPRRRRLGLVLLVLLLITTAVSGGVAAKYITARRAPRNIVDTQMFYFTSNVLAESTNTVNVSADTVSIELYNFADALRWAEMDIEYTVTVDEDATVSYPSETHKLAGNGKQTAVVTLSGLKDGTTYTVTATGTGGGYSKTISAKLVVSMKPKVCKSLAVSDDYVVLTVWTAGDVKGAVSIRCTADVIPDNTDPVMNTWGAGKGPWADSFSSAYSSHQYRFFTDKTLTADDFTVTVGGELAEEAEP